VVTIIHRETPSEATVARGPCGFVYPRKVEMQTIAKACCGYNSTQTGDRLESA